MSRRPSLAPLPDDSEVIRKYGPGEGDPWLEYQRARLAKRMPKLEPSDLEREVDEIIASATLTASTGGQRTISLSSRRMPDRSNGLRGVVLSTVIEQRRAELAARMAPPKAKPSSVTYRDPLTVARQRRRSLTAAAKSEAMPKVTPELALAHRIDALALEVQRADDSSANPTEDRTALNGSLLEAARAVVKAYEATQAGGA